MTKYYQASGKYSPVAFVYLLLVSLFVLPLLGGAYAYATWYIPIIYINVLVTVAFGLGIAFVIERCVIRLGKVRNHTLGIVFAVLGALVAYYAQWIVWADLALNTTDTIGNNRIGVAISNVNFEELFHLLRNPSDLFALIAEINSVGTWSLRSLTVSGIFLSLIWVAEIAVILYFVIFNAKQSRKPFSEVADQWMKEEKIHALSYIEQPDDFKRELELGNYEKISELTKSDHKQSHSLITLHSLGNEYYMSVSNTLAQQDSKGKVKFNMSELVANLRIDKSLYDTLKLKNKA